VQEGAEAWDVERVFADVRLESLKPFHPCILAILGILVILVILVINVRARWMPGY
jgi:hypothetical protein